MKPSQIPQFSDLWPQTKNYAVGSHKRTNEFRPWFSSLYNLWKFRTQTLWLSDKSAFIFFFWAGILPEWVILSCAMPPFLSRKQVLLPAAVLPLQLPAKVPAKTVECVPTACPCHSCGRREGSWFLAVLDSWDLTQQMEYIFLLLFVHLCFKWITFAKFHPSLPSK